MVYEKLSGASAQGYRIIFDRPIGHGFVAQYPNRCWSVLEEWIQKVKEGL
jgi:hypothetical protein